MWRYSQAADCGSFLQVPYWHLTTARPLSSWLLDSCFQAVKEQGSHWRLFWCCWSILMAAVFEQLQRAQAADWLRSPSCPFWELLPGWLTGVQAALSMSWPAKPPLRLRLMRGGKVESLLWILLCLSRWSERENRFPHSCNINNIVKKRVFK
jgi:hypothetical protein